MPDLPPKKIIPSLDFKGREVEPTNPLPVRTRNVREVPLLGEQGQVLQGRGVDTAAQGLARALRDTEFRLQAPQVPGTAPHVTGLFNPRLNLTLTQDQLQQMTMTELMQLIMNRDRPRNTGPHEPAPAFMNIPADESDTPPARENRVEEQPDRQEQEELDIQPLISETVVMHPVAQLAQVESLNNNQTNDERETRAERAEREHLRRMQEARDKRNNNNTR